MAHLIPIPFLVVTVSLLVRSASRPDRKGELFWKPLSTMLVITVALLSLGSPGAQPAYTIWVTVGLVLSLGGDVALMFGSNRPFLIGLVLFLLAHIAYSVAFTVPNGFHPADLVSGTVLLAIGVAVYLYLRPGLGRMKGPVILYMGALCFMVNRAVSTLFGTAFTPVQAWILTIGSVLFLLSDLFLAVDRFRRPLRSKLPALVLYYGGQLLIALSPSYFEQR
jgi:uncharacterized membrane protein YhhN